MRPAKPRAIEEIVSDGDRIDLTLEAMVGARWLLMFASESLRGSAALQAEWEEAAGVLSLVDELLAALKRRRAKIAGVWEDRLALRGRSTPLPES